MAMKSRLLDSLPVKIIWHHSGRNEWVTTRKLFCTKTSRDCDVPRWADHLLSPNLPSFKIVTLNSVPNNRAHAASSQVDLGTSENIFTAEEILKNVAPHELRGCRCRKRRCALHRPSNTDLVETWSDKTQNFHRQNPDQDHLLCAETKSFVERFLYLISQFASILWSYSNETVRFKNKYSVVTTVGDCNRTAVRRDTNFSRKTKNTWFRSVLK